MSIGFKIDADRETVSCGMQVFDTCRDASDGDIALQAVSLYLLTRLENSRS